MSDPKQHVTSLTMSRKLKDAGVPQDGMFWIGEDEGITWAPDSSDNWKRFCAQHNIVCAYTASELGAMLPSKIHYRIVNGEGEPAGTVQGYLNTSADLCGYAYPHESGHLIDVIHGRADTEANARAALLLRLIEHKHVDPHTINESAHV